MGEPLAQNRGPAREVRRAGCSPGQQDRKRHRLRKDLSRGDELDAGGSERRLGQELADDALVGGIVLVAVVVVISGKIGVRVPMLTFEMAAALMVVVKLRGGRTGEQVARQHQPRRVFSKTGHDDGFDRSRCKSIATSTSVFRPALDCHSESGLHPHFVCVTCGSVTCLGGVKLHPALSLRGKQIESVAEILLRGHCKSCE